MKGKAFMNPWKALKNETDDKFSSKTFKVSLLLKE